MSILLANHKHESIVVI